MSMKNSNDTTGNRTHDLLACSAVPQPTAPPAACPVLIEGIRVFRDLIPCSLVDWHQSLRENNTLNYTSSCWLLKDCHVDVPILTKVLSHCWILHSDKPLVCGLTYGSTAPMYIFHDPFPVHHSIRFRFTFVQDLSHPLPPCLNPKLQDHCLLLT